MEVEWVDQQKINEFSKLSSKLDVYETLKKKLTQEKEDLDDLQMEIELVDEDEKLMYTLGEAFVYLPQAEIVERLEKDKEVLEEKISKQTDEMDKIVNRLNELKTALYARFGRENINLEK